MPTQSFVESGFWCFDALFVPQQHPARDLQDTFYLSDPSHSLPPERDYYNRVATVHEKGGYGSSGYRAPWQPEESSKLLLRTHTTASSAAMLYKLAARCRGEPLDEDDVKSTKDSAVHGAAATDDANLKLSGNGDDGFRPAKLFSIDRVFRNETMDATHLAEFHQVEGVVADRNLTLADLIGRPRSVPQCNRGFDLVLSRVHEGFLQQDGYRERPLQARLQPLHRGEPRLITTMTCATEILV